MNFIQNIIWLSSLWSILSINLSIMGFIYAIEQNSNTNKHHGEEMLRQ